MIITKLICGCVLIRGKGWIKCFDKENPITHPKKKNRYERKN